MAKRKSSYVKGLSTSDILKMPVSQFEKLTPSQQREVVSRLVSSGNKRLRTFDKYNEQSSAVRELRSTGEQFLSTRGKTGTALTEEFERARKFMRQKVSTRKGWIDVVKKIQKGYKAKGIVDATLEQTKQIVMAMDELSQLNPDVIKRAQRYKVTAKIAEAYVDPNYRKSITELFAEIQDEIELAESDIHNQEYVGDIDDYGDGFATFFRRTDDF